MAENEERNYGDMLQGGATAAGGVAGGYAGQLAGGKLAELAYKRALDKVVERAVRDSLIYGKRGLYAAGQGLEGVGGKLADLGVGAQLKAGGLGGGIRSGAVRDLGKGLSAAGRLSGDLGSRLQMSEKSLNAEGVAKALQSSKMKFLGGKGNRAQALLRSGGKVPTKWTRAGKIGGGALGALIGAGTAYAASEGGRRAIAKLLDK